jgi:nitrogen fixation protein NifU and related proteins
MSDLDSLYKEIILEHHEDPRNKGVVENPDASEEGFNPLCGDRVTVDLKYGDSGETLENVMFRGEGCAICMASASIMTEELIGESIDSVKSSIEKFRALMQGKVDPEVFDSDVGALAGVRKFPVRIKCALLAWTTMNQALLKSEREVS